MHDRQLRRGLHHTGQVGDAVLASEDALNFGHAFQKAKVGDFVVGDVQHHDLAKFAEWRQIRKVFTGENQLHRAAQ